MGHKPKCNFASLTLAFLCAGGGGGGAPFNGLYREVLPERATFLRLQEYKRVGISQVEVYENLRI